MAETVAFAADRALFRAVDSATQFRYGIRASGV